MLSRTQKHRKRQFFTSAASICSGKDKLDRQSDFEQAFLRDKGRLPMSGGIA